MTNQPEIQNQPEPSSWDERDHFPEPRTIPAGWDMSEMKPEPIVEDKIEVRITLELKKDLLV